MFAFWKSQSLVAGDLPLCLIAHDVPTRGCLSERLCPLFYTLYNQHEPWVYDRPLVLQNGFPKEHRNLKDIMETDMGIRTVCRAPTNYYYDNPLPSSPYAAFDIETELVPKPLFSRPTVLPPVRATYAVVEPSSPIYMSSIPSASTSRAPSLQSSQRSISSSVSSKSTPMSSAPTSPCPRTRSLACSSSPSAWYTPVSTPVPQPARPLRRKVSPTHETLRSIRAKESDACLQRVYDEQVSAYLSGALFSKGRMKPELEGLEEG